MSPTKAALYIGAFSIFSKILGAVRQAVMAHQFGAGIQVDIYVAAFRFPDLIFNLFILGTLSVAFIPVFVDYFNRDKEEAFRISATIFNATLLVMGTFGVLGLIFAPLIVHIVVPGFSPDAMKQTILLTRVLMLSPLLFSLSSVLTSVLQSTKRFILPAIVPLLYNLSIIVGIIFLYPRMGLVGLAWGAVFGAFLHFVFQLPSALRLGFRPWGRLKLGHPGVKKFGKLFLPRIFGLDMGQISLIVASVIGSSLGAGSIAVFYFGYDLQTVPLGVFAVSIAIVAFPILSELAAQKNLDGFKQYLAKNIVQVLFLMIPISVLILLLRAQIVRLIYGAGHGTAFTFADTRLVASTLGFFALSLFAQSLIPLLARGFYALQNTIIPVVAGFIAAAVNITLAVIFAKIYGAPAMALAFSIASVANMLILYVLLRRRMGDMQDDYVFLSVIKISIASVVMAIMTYLTLYAVAPTVNMQTYLGILIQTIAASVVAAASYILIGLAIKIPESANVLALLRSWFRKFTGPVASAIVNMFTDLR